jgi:hypothetical protein
MALMRSAWVRGDVVSGTRTWRPNTPCDQSFDGIVEVAWRHEELPELFLESHPAEEVTRPLRDGKPCVAIGHDLPPGTGGQGEECRERQATGLDALHDPNCRLASRQLAIALTLQN